VNDHRIIEEGQQEAAIGAFLIAHQGHTQHVEVQRGAWTVYCRCKRCEDVRTYEVNNEARERALGLPPWPESKTTDVQLAKREGPPSGAAVDRAVRSVFDRRCKRLSSP